jgi:heme A synthase
MNYNIIGYFIFITIIALIIVFVGRICYRNGNIFVAELIPDHLDICQQINKTLLVAYYLINIGYCAMTLVGWEEVKSGLQLIEVLSVKVATIICILSVLHYSNIIILTTYIHKLIK